LTCCQVPFRVAKERVDLVLRPRKLPAAEHDLYADASGGTLRVEVPG